MLLVRSNKEDKSSVLWEQPGAGGVSLKVSDPLVIYGSQEGCHHYQVKIRGEMFPPGATISFLTCGTISTIEEIV